MVAQLEKTNQRLETSRSALLKFHEEAPPFQRKNLFRSHCSVKQNQMKVWLIVGCVTSMSCTTRGFVSRCTLSSDWNMQISMVRLSELGKINIDLSHPGWWHFYARVVWQYSWYSCISFIACTISKYLPAVSKVSRAFMISTSVKWKSPWMSSYHFPVSRSSSFLWLRSFSSSVHG